MFKVHFRNAVIFAVLGLIVGGLIAFFSPRVYEATAEVLLGEAAVSGQATTSLSPDVQRILGAGQANDAITELQVLRSQSVFFDALREVAGRTDNNELLRQFVPLFMMYDVITPETRITTQDQGSVATIRVRAYNDPRLAEQICSQIAEVYNDFRLRNGRSGLQNAIRYLQGQEGETNRSLREAEEKLKNYTTDKGIASIEAATASATSEVSILRQQLAQLEGQAAGARAEASELRGNLGQFRETSRSTQTSPNPRLNQLQSDLVTLTGQLESLRVRFYDDHPRIQETERAIAEKRKQIESERKLGRLEESTVLQSDSPARQQMEQLVASADARADSFEQQEREMRDALASAETRLKALPNDEAQIRQLRRDVQIAEQNYSRVNIQLNELRSRQETGVRGITVLSPARAFDLPIAPDNGKFVFIGLIAGLAIGLIYSFATEAMKIRVHTSQMLSELTGLPVAATVPVLGRAQRRRATDLAKPGARPGESFRHMAFTMMAKNPPLPRVVLVTGLGSIQGRSTSAIQLAMALAGNGSRVALVDADPMRQVVTKAFALEGKTGLSDLLDRRALPSEGATIVQSTVHENLVIVPVGSDTTRTIGDRDAASVEGAVKALASLADVVIVDAPPCDLFSDASRLASHCDETCLVVSAANTNFNAIPNGYDILHRAGAKEVSLILTDASRQDEPFTDTSRYSRTS